MSHEHIASNLGYAYFPSPLSSIFSPKLKQPKNGVRMSLNNIGARGGGFSLTKGCETWVRIYPDEDGIEVLVNDAIVDFPPSVEAAKEMKKRYSIEGKIAISHRIHVPIGVGFGTSAASAAGVVMALSTITRNFITLKEAIRIVHSVELKCRTGLNSEVGLMTGGLVLVLREGAPPNCIVDSLPIPQYLKILSLVSGMMKTPDVLSDLSSIEELERVGDKFMRFITMRPSVENFLRYAREFAYEAGFVCEDVEEMFEVLRRLPVVGYAQNMLGKAVHALVHQNSLEFILKELMDYFPNNTIVASDVTSTYKVSYEGCKDLSLNFIDWQSISKNHSLETSRFCKGYG